MKTTVLAPTGAATPSRAHTTRPLNLCRCCGRDFASVAAFDRHRTGVHAYTHREGLRMEPPRTNGRRCLDPDEVLDHGMALDQRGRWAITADADRARGRFQPDAPRGSAQAGAGAVEYATRGSTSQRRDTERGGRPQ